MQFLDIPGTCPCCGFETEVRQDPTSGVYTLWCNNPDCSAKGNKKLEHFVKRDCMNIDGISGATLMALVDAGIVTDFTSIYHIKEHRNEIVNLEGFGDQSFLKMVQAIEKSREVQLHNLIFALGIPNIGLATAKLICENFNYDVAETIFADYDELMSINGIGDVIAESFTDYFADEDNRNQFTSLIKELVIKEPVAKIDASMAGVTICVTGSVYIFNNRKEIEDLIVRLGGKLTKSVSKSTSYLVTNDTGTGSRKNVAAAKYGIPILSEQEFIDKFNLSQYIGG